MNEGSVRQVGSQRDLYERPADRFVAGFVGRTTFLAGTVEAFVTTMRTFLHRASRETRWRVFATYGRWLVAGLTFQLAADILETSITTTWQAVARLGAIAVIRTFLNFFLERDLNERAGRHSAAAKEDAS